MTFLGIDAGGSATRWALCDASGAPRGGGEVGPASGHLFDAAARANFATMVAGLRDAIGTRVSGVVAGITGLTSTAPEAKVAAGIIADGLNIPPAAVQVHDDMWIGYHAAFRPGEGHVVYSGTGSVGTHVRLSGEVVRSGGRGILIDDGGSAFWIGQMALRLVWRRRDESPDSNSILAESLAAAIGGADWDVMRGYVYAGGRSKVAALARAVAAADDADARAILHAAGGELARLANALVRRAGVKPVALLGRAAALHSEILRGFRDAAPALEVNLANPDAALAAARLAAKAVSAQARIDTRGD